MKIYVAGKTHQYERVRRIQSAVKRFGHEITFDWTENVAREMQSAARLGRSEPIMSPQTTREYANADLLGVAECDMFIGLIDDQRIAGTIFEFGAAYALQKQIILIGTPGRNMVFWNLSNLTHIQSEIELVDHVPFLNP